MGSRVWVLNSGLKESMTPTLISVFSAANEAAEIKINPARSPLKMDVDLIL